MITTRLVPCSPAQEILDHVANAVRTRRIDYMEWTLRWDRMQERYIAQRYERIRLIIDTIRGTQKKVANILDLGCGAGTLTWAALDAFPGAQVYGVDFDPTLLPLAEACLVDVSHRTHLILADLRDASWLQLARAKMDAVISATALHWLSPEQLSTLYKQLAGVLRPKGIFLNADHVASDHAPLQQAWEQNRDKIRAQRKDLDGETWPEFWQSYAQALGLEVGQIHQRVIDGWNENESVEQGLPLAWHFDQLRAAGFTSVDCFWRCDCDAIYGGIR